MSFNTPSPITFYPIAGVVSCKPFTFTFSYTETGNWYEGKTSKLLALVSRAPDNGSSPTVQQTLSNADVVYPADWEMFWSPVTAGAGDYVIVCWVGSNSNTSYAPSSQFFSIAAGSDESCLNATATSAVPISRVPGGVTFATATQTAIGVSSSSTERTQLAGGAVAGLTVGIFAILFGLLLAAILFVRRRRAARAQNAQASELPAYATVVRAGSLMVEKEKKDMDSKSDSGQPLENDRESLRSVPPAYHHGND